MDDRLVAVLHAVPTLCLTGLIWFVQVAHYPMFASIPAGDLPAYEQRYTRRVTWVVAPLMFAEVGASLWLWWSLEAERTLTTVGLALLAVLWLSTALLQVPCHHALAQRADAATVRRLVRTNWIRTAAWTARAVLAVVILR